MKSSARTSRWGTILPPLLVATGFLIIWECVSILCRVPEYILPPPHKVALDVFYNLGELGRHGGITLAEGAVGFLLANVLAIALAVGISFVPSLAKGVMPLAIALKTTPVVAMAPLLLLWFGTGLAPKIAAAALISFFPALVNSLQGLHSLEVGELDLLRVYGASKLQVLLKARLPRAAPYVFSALKISSSLCIVGAIIGEFVGANEGIGYVILVSSYHLETVRMFSALLVAAAAGVIFYGVVSFVERRVVFWTPEQPDEFKAVSPNKASPQTA